MKERDNNFNFTKKALDIIELPVNGKRHYFYDTKIKGLELMLTEQGTKSFKVYRKFKGKPVRVTLGKYPEMTVENARNEAQRVISDMISGKNPNQQKKSIQAEISFGDMFHLFMERYSKQNKKSWKADDQDVPRFLSHWFQKIRRS